MSLSLELLLNFCCVAHLYSNNSIVIARSEERVTKQSDTQRQDCFTAFAMTINEQNVQVSDTTGDATCATVGNIIIMHSLLIILPSIFLQQFFLRPISFFFFKQKTAYEIST